MITRRDALKIAATLAAARTMPSPVNAAEAARLLDLPATTLPAKVEQDSLTHDELMQSPAGFAQEMRGSIDDDTVMELDRFTAPEEWAEMRQARATLLQSLNVDGDIPFNHPFHVMDEAVLAWGFAAYAAGLAHGAAYEQLRGALIGKTASCVRCDGSGLISPIDGRWWHRGPSAPCPDCAGSGLQHLG